MPARLEGRSILVVDDDPDVLSTVRLAFEQAGAKVTTANDGNKALDFAKRFDPDLIVLDMMMPKRSGFLVMEMLKPGHETNTRPYVIMITANEGKRHELYARHLGVNEYLSKPFSLDKLLETACKLLGGEFIEAE
ncbi:MAG: two-component system response regulator [Phycisphaerae bacterium]|nr:MAG: response regulator [Planctomycetia bacterium]GJQ25527.1 MAG: two-component system response regulator [Phycisphaerae bacterium]